MQSKIDSYLIIGKGGREHALGWRISKDRPRAQLFFSPGNAGTRALGTNLDINTTKIDRLLDFAIDNEIGLTVVGPESSLSVGIVNAFRNADAPIFGPTQEATLIESSKIFSATSLRRWGVPQPDFYVPEDFQDAQKFCTSNPWPNGIVVKANGLAGGKGVIVTDDSNHAIDTIHAMMVKNTLGDAGKKVLLQERIGGPNPKEVSVVVMTDGDSYRFLPLTQDHKRLLDDDGGPNTGGMGTFAPITELPDNFLGNVGSTIIEPTLAGMSSDGNPFTGALFAGLIVESDGKIKAIEFNARFGDPETQVQLPLIDHGFTDLLHSCAVNGGIRSNRLTLSRQFATCVVLASSGYGYPERLRTGQAIIGLDKLVNRRDVLVFHAGTSDVENGRIIVDGGRVLNIVGMGNSRTTSTRNAYDCIGQYVYFDGMIYRTDIGKN